MTAETSETSGEPTLSSGSSANLQHRLQDWAVRVGLARKFAFSLTVCAIIAAVLTYLALTSYGPEPRTVEILFVVDLVLLLALSVIVAWRVVDVWVARRRGSAGSRLHVRLVVLFALIAITPAIVVSVFYLLIFHLGFQAWFSEKVSTALEESNAVAEAYLKEHQQNIRNDVLAMAQDINREGSAAYGNPARFNQLIAAHAALRSLSEAVVFEASGRVLAKTGTSFILDLEAPPPTWAFEEANAGKVALLISDRGDRVRALVRLDRIRDTYLYVSRFVDNRVLEHMEKTQRAVKSYEQLEGRRSGLQITFALVFVVVALLLLLAAVWFGLAFATYLARPVSQMIAAAEKVRAGDLTARVDHSPRNDELGSLSRAFNRMTSQLETQRAELVEANRQLELRRRFTETVLTGVSAGVIGLDGEGRINLPNRSASELLSTDLDNHIDENLAEVVPEMAELLRLAMEQPSRLAEAQIKLARRGLYRTLLVRIVAEEVDDKTFGYVVTFDDISDLLSAQRKAAWADVARRIAHEIKNPLTPIQLSAERLKRKYLKEISSDPEPFLTCTDTIIRQVNDIGRMVGEFSSFARMPQPVMEKNDLGELCRQAVFLQDGAYPEITFTCDCPEGGVEANCDANLISQVLTNILKNAAESIESREGGKEKLPPGRVSVRLGEEDGLIVIVVEDNGCGFPAEGRENLAEPYVTTRTRGTGLGLAIVKKIMEEHQGGLILEDNEAGGARVRLLLPRGDKPVVVEEEAGKSGEPDEDSNGGYSESHGTG